jgi:hypothetical protein
MLSEEFPVEVILEAIDNMAQPTSEKRPKVILFDIGGVCVCNPMPFFFLSYTPY